MAKHPDAAFGLIPWGPVLHSQLYAVQTEPTIGFYHGDAVQHGGTALSTPWGWMPIVEDADVIANNDLLIGVVIAVFDEDMYPVKCIEDDEVGDGTFAGYLLIADDPDQLFIVQEDANTTPIPATSIEMNCDLEPATENLGDNDSGRSKMELDSTTASTTANLHVKLMYPHPEDTIPGVEGTYHTRWIVKINAHAKGTNIIGKVTST